MILEITEQGAYLSKDHESFVVKSDAGKTEFPAQKIDSIIISGNASISTAAIRLCLEHDIQLVIAEPWGEPIGRFWFPTSGKNSEIRRRQYLAKDNQIGLTLSREIVSIKLREQRKLLSDLRRNRPSENQSLNEAIDVIGNAISQMEKTKFRKESLLGIEGNASKYYFSALSSILPQKYRFDVRSQHPPKDPFNAILNYGYGIGYREIETAIIVSGLDPNAGFYHQDQYGKPTLSYDVIELFRPKIDRLILYLFAKKQVCDDWFEYTGDACFLTKTGRKAVIAAYYPKTHEHIQKQAWAFCRGIIRNLMHDER